MRFIGAAMLLAVHAAGCNDDAALKMKYSKSDSIQLRIEKALAFGADPEFVNSFDFFPELASAVKSSQDFHLYEGTPRSYGREDSAVEERTTTLDSYEFYKDPRPISGDIELQLRNRISSEKTFYPFGGGKLCGGFHPDWCLVLGTADGPLNVHLCFGCGELKAIRNGELKIYCDFREGLQEPLESVLYQVAIPRAAQGAAE